MDSSSTIVEFTRVYLAIFYSCVAAFYALRITAKKRAGLPEVVFPGERFSTTWWNHMLFRAFRLTIWMVCLFRYFFPGIDSYLGFFVYINVWPVVLAGNILLTAGFLFTVVIHFSLGSNWRSGIDPNKPEKLRTDGFYRFSRNPMFLGIATAQVGFLLAIPSVFSAVCLIIGLYTLHSQTLAEEAHLMKLFPKDYRHYIGHVRRWL
ncbi:isoprenylcysteine carboxylmethyltransferase family protein [Seongchinamella unica]|uniref:Isoprenylcysteine carboxylmethyltransferase family protein n=1 Tax=Seongchinamella unica TaxID=2547392 RepID=A0A4R5LQ59_9GAMM|nr:isoprenylcysteine carboxylmethyltransferase family protein [Seongchinamella unica]TDG12605.1 isoprenylcysteine carboxylmethyltransferase family protein [Seongchinamella unica]